MTDILEKYPTPWTVCNEHWVDDPHIRDGNDTFVLAIISYDIDVLYFITELVNNSVKPKITDQSCACICGWQGIVLDCLPDIDGDGGLGCPECETVIEV